MTNPKDEWEEEFEEFAETYLYMPDTQAFRKHFPEDSWYDRSGKYKIPLRTVVSCVGMHQLKIFIRTLLAKQREECSNKVNNLINIHHEANARMHALILEIRAQHKREVEALTLKEYELSKLIFYKTKACLLSNDVVANLKDCAKLAKNILEHQTQKLSEARDDNR